jgi:hypothetical protein
MRIWFINIKNFLNWRLIRSIAELQILTRATYLMLIFVPILAGVWPAVRLYVNNHNEAVVKATGILENHYKNFSDLNKTIDKNITTLSEKSITPEQAIKKLQLLNDNGGKFLKDIEQFSNDFLPRTLDSPNLPKSWAIAFFASLFAAIAHLIYQLTTPENFRKYTLSEFIQIKKEAYSRHPSDYAFENAHSLYTDSDIGMRDKAIHTKKYIKIFNSLKALLNEESNDDENEQLLKNEIKKLSVSELSNFHDYFKDSINPNDEQDNYIIDIATEIYNQTIRAIGPKKEKELRDMAEIEKSAKIEYLNLANNNRVFAIITGLFYCSSIYLIFRIINFQISNIMEFSGWSSYFDIFYK